MIAATRASIKGVTILPRAPTAMSRSILRSRWQEAGLLVTDEFPQHVHADCDRHKRLVCRPPIDSRASRAQSRGKYFPFGEERTNPIPANPTNDQEKFATYTRDSATGLDYAYQRYYNSPLGRFHTPDADSSSPRLKGPQSWNRYAYVEGQTVSAFDPDGRKLAIIGQDCQSFDVFEQAEFIASTYPLM
jgi:RHS repeat-associated protein